MNVWLPSLLLLLMHAITCSASLDVPTSTDPTLRDDSYGRRRRWRPWYRRRRRTLPPTTRSNLRPSCRRPASTSASQA
ncbi:hypothetical protein B0J15DRAFT_224629 [Fusarium solani]|uniref:Secreted protein n=1 Tax=Fusarium solani TaxID=169388 RepID=A0A9P9L0P1_FUSSL|nr:uncharacterized protein B0J15DRAFT_224629 [Fusarium solani]KAH7271833.1 hypothetical protein B0J15DRAFT_224629 [Fusarium solani]